MNLLILSVLILSIVLVSCQFHNNKNNNKRLENEWNLFKRIFNKNYTTKGEDTIRFKIWKANNFMIKEHNRKASKGIFNFTLKINKFGDLTNKEYIKFIDGIDTGLPRPRGIAYQPKKNIQIAESVDWRKLGYVSPVKNQGPCGSCWAFSSTGALEGQYFNKTGKMVSLSEQDLVDCSGKYGNYGCNGGFMTNAFAFVMDNGIMSSEQYPYKAHKGKCKHKSSKVVEKASNFFEIPSGNEFALQEACSSVGPISVAIDASSSSFQFYSQGVYFDQFCGNTEWDLNHGVLLVGYTSDSYIVKNSWGSDWGDKGYIKMSKNRSNNCGISTLAAFPII